MLSPNHSRLVCSLWYCMGILVIVISQRWSKKIFSTCLKHPVITLHFLILIKVFPIVFSFYWNFCFLGGKALIQASGFKLLDLLLVQSSGSVTDFICDLKWLTSLSYWAPVPSSVDEEFRLEWFIGTYYCWFFMNVQFSLVWKYEVDVEGEVEGMLVRFSFVFLKTKAE